MKLLLRAGASMPHAGECLTPCSHVTAEDGLLGQDASNSELLLDAALHRILAACGTAKQRPA